MALIFLKEVESVQRTDHKQYCFEIVSKGKSYYIACKTDDELYSWMDEIYQVINKYLNNELYLSILMIIIRIQF